MSIRIARERIGRLFTQRCFYLFVVLLTLVVGVPFVEPTTTGRLVISAVNVLVIIAAVAAVGRTLLSFVIVVLLSLAALTSQYLGIAWGDTEHVIRSWIFGAVLYAVTIIYMVLYVFQRDVMTADKLFGAAAAYLLLGVLWMFIYALVGHFYPGSFLIGGAAVSPLPLDLLYFSFTVLTSTGFGDIVPVTRQARALCVMEQLVGALFTAILIARLAGVYPPKTREG